MKPTAPPELNDDYRSAVRELESLALFTGPPKEFWPRYLDAIGKLTCAERTLLYVRAKSDGNGENSEGGDKDPWRRVGDWRLTSNNLFEFAARQVDEMATDIATSCRESGGGCGCIVTAGEWDEQLSARFPSMDVTGIAVRPLLHSTSETCLVVALIENIDGASAAEMLVRLQLAGDCPRNYQANIASRQAGTQIERLATALDLSLVVNEKERFYACALAFCNAVASQLKCDRVSLGWIQSTSNRIQADQAAVALNQHILDDERARLVAGSSEIRRVLEVESDLFKSKNTVLRDIVEYQRARLELELVMGTLLMSRGWELTQEQLKEKTERLLAEFSSAANGDSKTKKGIFGFIRRALSRKEKVNEQVQTIPDKNTVRAPETADHNGRVAAVQSGRSRRADQPPDVARARPRPAVEATAGSENKSRAGEKRRFWEFWKRQNPRAK